MTTTKIQEMAQELVNNKCNEATARMAEMPKCKEIFTQMVKEGFTEQARVFKRIVLLTTILHPEMSDLDILEEYAKRQGII